ncbi:MAG: CPBP family glutamic-type intramembrane protease [Aggregatilineales bacterium]
MVNETLAWHRRWLQRWQGAHRATRLMIGVWLGALVYLVLMGYPIFGLLLLAALVVLGSLLTLILTERPPKVGRVVMGAPYNRIVSQIAVVLGVAALTSLSISGYVPLWSEVIGIFRGIGRAYFSPALLEDGAATLGNFGALFVIPALLLMALGARWHELGTAKGHRSGQVALLWCALPAVFILLALWARAVSLPVVLRSLLTSAFYAFSAEFLFRGALQTRLLRLLAPRWALLLQALIFALWQVPSLAGQLGHNLLASMALGIAQYGVLGLALGLIALRTRNVWAGTAFAAVINALGLLSYSVR